MDNIVQVENNEKQFQQYIVCYLRNNNNYHKRDNADFDIINRICRIDFEEFIKNTQYDNLHKISYNDAEAFTALIKLIRNEINNKSLLSVIKNGIDITGICKNIDKQDSNRYMIYPVACPNEINKTLKSICNSNIMSVIPEFKYCKTGGEENNRIDLAILVNGFPIVAIELKLRSSGQTYEDAINQWKNSRTPKYDLLKSKTGFLVYLAMDDLECFMTTKLLNNETYFLPFNQGSNGAGKEGSKGNPVIPGKYSTCYIWENILKQENLLDIIYNYTYEIKEEISVNQNELKLIFPRYHQYDCVNKMQQSIRNNGVGLNYLAQHSTGSGKSNSIAWLALRLANMQDNNNKPLFRAVIVVVDRVILIKQLFSNIKSFDKSDSIVFPENSAELKGFIERGNCKIIVTTIQKFGRIDEYNFGDKPKYKYAIIADEAHSGETGKNQQKLIDNIGEDVDELEKFKKLTDVENVSLFAFTATPSKEVINIFGTQTECCKEPFHIYSMKQAVSEGFIIDVLGKNNFISKDPFYHLKVIEGGDRELTEQDERKLKKAISEDIKSNKLIAEEVVKDFLNQIMYNSIKCKSSLNEPNKNNNKCRGMIICSSRAHACIIYEQVINWLDAAKNNELTGIKEREFIDGIIPLIAFSGKLKKNENGQLENYESDKNEDKSEKADLSILSEESLNINYCKQHDVVINGKKIEKISVNDTAKVFKSINFAILIVANKFQTGFDDKYLNCMYVIKPMRDRNIVQTYSRLNRTCNTPEETESKCPRIVDYVNDIDRIIDAYSKYYTATKLKGNFNILGLFEIYENIIESEIINKLEIGKLVAEYDSKNRNEQVISSVGAVVKDRLDKLHEEVTDKQHNKNFIEKLLDKFRFNGNTKLETSQTEEVVNQLDNDEPDKSIILGRLIRKYIKDYEYAIKFIDIGSKIPDCYNINETDLLNLYKALVLIVNIIKTSVNADIFDIKVEVDDLRFRQNTISSMEETLKSLTEYVEQNDIVSCNVKEDTLTLTVKEWVEKFNIMYNSNIDCDKTLTECIDLANNFRSRYGENCTSESSDFDFKLIEFIKEWNTKLGADITMNKINGREIKGNLAKMRDTHSTEELKEEFSERVYTIARLILTSLENKN